MNYNIIENFKNIAHNLFSTNIIPQETMILSEQMLCLGKLILLVSILLLIFGFNFKQTLSFCLFSLLFINIIYYIKKNNMETFIEKYDGKYLAHTSDTCNDLPIRGKPISYQLPRVVDDKAFFYCNDQVQLEPFDKSFISANQRLVGPPNPKTKIAPVIIPPSHDLEYWRANNLINHSHVNILSQQDVYQSGYEVLSQCKPKTKRPNVKEGYCSEGTCGNQSNNPKYGSNKWHPQQEQASSTNKSQTDIYNENFQNYFPFRQQSRKTPSKQFIDDSKNKPNVGQINTSCGYNPDQVFSSNLPSNYASSNCQEDPKMAQYNKNLFTQIIEPGVYSINQVNEPINSNIGISFTQQFEPMTYSNTQDGILYTEHDPRIMEPLPEEVPVETVNEANVYDPRFTGYGTSYRSYIDKQLGQPRFIYDDVNAIRMPNYLVRSKIDFEPYADSYGPMKAGQPDGNNLTANIREMTQDSWIKNSNQFRDDIMVSAMRKRNGEMWQNRMYPNSTSGQRMAGGMSGM